MAAGYMDKSEKLLQELKEIQNKLNKVNYEINYQYRVMTKELEERKRLNLKGQEALEHFNMWMKNSGLEHLVIK